MTPTRGSKGTELGHGLLVPEGEGGVEQRSATAHLNRPQSIKGETGIYIVTLGCQVCGPELCLKGS